MLVFRKSNWKKHRMPKCISILNFLIILTCTILLIACGQAENNVSNNKGFSPLNPDTIHTVKTVNWYESLLIDYIQHSNNELIKLSQKDTASKIEWVFDRIEKTDTATYMIFRIGTDVADDDSTNIRFMTDSWVYIDSLTRKLYEYDFQTDKLVQWKNNN